MTTPPVSGLRHTGEHPNHTTPKAEEQTRQWLLQRLREIMEIAMERVANTKTLASDRVKWSRIAIAAGQACNAVLRDVEIDAVKRQISELKQLTLSRLGEDQDENQQPQTGTRQTETDD